MIKDHETIDVFIGVDVGKSNHHAVALDRTGKKLLDKALPQDEAKLKAMIKSLAKHGRLLFVVDQPATIGALPVAVAQARGIPVGYLPGLAMRRIADLHPGRSQDRRERRVHHRQRGHAPCRTPCAPSRSPRSRSPSWPCSAVSTTTWPRQATATSNRIRGLLTQIHPALERVIGKHLDHPAMAELLAKYPTPAALRRAGEARVGSPAAQARTPGRGSAGPATSSRPWQPAERGRLRAPMPPASSWPDLARMLAQTAARPGPRSWPGSRHSSRPTRCTCSLISMPGVGIRTAARILTEVVGKEFATPGHLASYAGLAPVTWRSGTSIRGDHSSSKGNKTLKRAFFLSAFASLKCKDPASRAYYDKKRAEGKKHNQAVIALARRRCNVLFAMLRDGTVYEAPEATVA